VQVTNNDIKVALEVCFLINWALHLLSSKGMANEVTG